MVTIGKEFVKFLEELLGLEFGKDLFYMRTPDVDTPVFWVVQNSGVVSWENKTNEKLKEYSFTLNFRDTSAENVDKTIEKVESILSKLKCIRFKCHYVYRISLSTLPSQDDVDSEDRYRGSLNITLHAYDKAQIDVEPD